jgi:ATP phosphoribosyltransferase-like protein
VAEAFHCGARVTDLFVTAPARSRHRDLVGEIADAGIPVHLVSGEVMDELAQTVTPQGLLAVCGFVDVPLAEVTGQQSPGGPPGLVALLANVRDPGNAGTVLRTADAAGAHAVVFADASVDPYNGKCVRASAGSLFHLPVVAGARLKDAAGALRAAGLRILDTILVSFTELVANPAAYDEPVRRHAMHQLHTLLAGTLEARGKVLVKLNVSEDNLDRVIEILPSMKSPTVSKLFGEGGYAVETVVAKADINILIPALKDAGATDIIELPLAKIVH